MARYQWNSKIKEDQIGCVWFVIRTGYFLEVLVLKARKIFSAAFSIINIL